MKKSFLTLAAATAMIAALAACNSVPKTSSPAAEPSNPATKPTGTNSAVTAPAKPDATKEQATPVVQTPAPAPTPAPAAIVEVKKTYHMNKNYDIVPNDPSGNKKVVLLTFDDGPKEKEMIDSLFDTLDKHKAKAIFFMNGYRIKAHPELLKLVDQRGGILGNHAWDHDDLKKMTNEKIDQQVDDVTKIMKDQLGKTPQFFRPPFGNGTDYVKEKVKKAGMLYMTWSNGSLDWDMTVKKNDPDKVVKNVLDQLHPGSNILMHELPWTCKALDALLTQLEEKGYSFVDPQSIELEMR